MNLTGQKEALLTQLAQGLPGHKHVLAAMAQVPRERFVPGHLQARAYEDCPLAIGAEQTISQPSLVAKMLAALSLRPGDKVLEVGAGSGYQAALLHHMGCKVFTLEVRPQLAAAATAALASVGAGDVRVRVGDAAKGWPEEAPFAAIVVACAAPRVPDVLLEQLVHNGHLLMPVGASDGVQQLQRWQRRHQAYRQETLGAVYFVPWVTTRQLDAAAKPKGD